LLEDNSLRFAVSQE